jgi:Na+/proline symporter
MILGLHPADITVLLIYLVVVCAIGFWTARTVGNLSDFIMPRKFGKFFMIMFTFGAGTHSDQAVSVASKSYTNGLSGIWYQWLYLFATPFYWLIAPVMRRFRAITTADIFELRYARSVGILFAVVGAAQLMVNIGTMLKGSGAIVDAATGGAIPANAAMIVMTVLFVAYGVAGGLSAAIITDLIQGLLTIAFSFMLLPLILSAVGGIAGIRESVANPDYLSLVAPGEIGVFYIVVISINGLIGIATQPHALSNCAAGRTENDGRVGFMFGSFTKRICTVAWCLTGLAAAAHFAGTPDMHPDLIYGAVAREYLPALLPGLLGVFLAATLASVMSSCDAFMIASAGLFTENIYKPLYPDRGDRHYVFIVRIASLVVVAGGLTFAYWVEGVIDALEIFWKMPAMIGIAFWLGLFWRRATTAGAWASTLAASLAWWVSTHAWFVAWVAGLPAADALGLVFEGSKGPEIFLPWQMTFYTAAGMIAGIVTSLLTRPVAEAQLDRFYALIRTPVSAEEQVPGPCMLPDGVTPPPARNLFPNSSLQFMVPACSSVLGFLLGCAIVAAIIGSVYWIASV